MISILPCSNCQQLLRMPSHATPQTKLACPKCQTEVTLEELWSELPAWDVVGTSNGASASTETNSLAGVATTESNDGSAEASEASEASESLAAALADDGELKLQEEEQTPRGKFAAKTKSSVDWSQFKPITYEEFERNKRKSGSSIGFIIQVALGGFAAIPIALLILWWGLGKDIGGAGPVVAKYAPWIVPSQFRPVVDDDADGAEFEDPDWGEVVEGEEGFRQFDDLAPPTEVESSTGLGADSMDGGEPALDPAVNPSGGPVERTIRRPASGADNADENESEVSVIGLGSATQGSTTQGANTQGSSQEMLVEPPGDEPEKGKPPTGDSATGDSATGDSATGDSNVFSAIQAAQVSLRQWNSATSGSGISAEEQRKLARSLYRDFVDVARHVHDLPEGNPVLRTVRESLRSLGNEVSGQASVQKVIRQGAKYWEKNNSSETVYQLALVVEIAEVEEGNRSWIVTPAGAENGDSGASLRSLAIPLELATNLEAGQKLFLLGTVVNDQNPSSQEGVAPSQPVFEACYLHAL